MTKKAFYQADKRVSEDFFLLEKLFRHRWSDIKHSISYNWISANPTRPSHVVSSRVQTLQTLSPWQRNRTTSGGDIYVPQLLRMQAGGSQEEGPKMKIILNKYGGRKYWKWTDGLFININVNLHQLWLSTSEEFW